MTGRRLLATLTCLAALSAPASDVGATGPVLILFSNSSNGSLRSCYCPNSPWGGLAKRAWLIGQLRSVAGAERVLLLDSGDLFPPDPEPDREDCVLRIYENMRYDAVAVGDQELAAGYDAWRKVSTRLPWLSAGYTPAPTGAAQPFPAKPWLIVEKAGRRIGIVSVVGPDVFRFSPEKLSGLTLNDSIRTVREFIAANGAALDMVVVLSHAGEDADRRLAEAVDGIDVIVGGHSQSLLMPPPVVNGALLCQAGKNGENLGILVLLPRGPDAVTPAATGESSPFKPATVVGRLWKAAGRLIPLDAAVDEAPAIGQLIDAYYETTDRNELERLTKEPAETPSGPTVLIEDPIQRTVMAPGETRSFTVTIRNGGAAPLRILKMRSRIRWLTVRQFPGEIEPDGEDNALLEIKADGIDRFFRSEWTLTSDDTAKPVVWGSINGSITGDLPGLLDVPGLWAELSNGVAPRPPREPGRALPSEQTGGSPRRVLVELFYAAGCDECREIEEDVLPAIPENMRQRIDLRRYDIFAATNYLRLATLQEKLNVRTAERVSIFIDGKIHLGGLQTIKERLLPEVEAAARARPEVRPEPLLQSETAAADIWANRLGRFTPWTIALAGLLDGLNPCAFATLIFFVTLLAVSGRKRHDLLAVGVGFCSAVFITYFLLGYGVFRALQALESRLLAAEAIRWLSIAALAALSGLSFRDAFRYWRRQDAGSLTLQLPGGVKRLIHAVMRTQLSARGILAGSFVAGVLVTILESVCTGQVYLPTLVYLSRQTDHRWHALGLLALYNLMFVTPHIAVFAAAYQGASNRRLLGWSRTHVVWSKIMLGLLFAGLGILLLLL